MAKTISPRFNHCLVISNPNSTNYSRSMRLARKLQRYIKQEDLRYVEISGDDFEKNAQIVSAAASKLDKSSLICVVGGDGTLSVVVNIMLRFAGFPAAAQEAAILPLWGGNANDMASMINGAPSSVRLKSIMTNGKRAAVYPLVVNTKRSGSSSDKYAVCYASFGVSAYTAELINQPNYRNMRFYHLTGARVALETASAIKAFVLAKPFMAETAGKQTSLYDLILVNGSRLAKMNRFPVRITEQRFYELSVHNKPSGLFVYLAQFLKWMPSKRTTQTKRSLTVKEPTWAQLDGEVTRVPAETKITIRPSVQPFYVLTTKLKI